MLEWNMLGVYCRNIMYFQTLPMSAADHVPGKEHVDRKRRGLHELA